MKVPSGVLLSTLLIMIITIIMIMIKVMFIMIILIIISIIVIIVMIVVILIILRIVLILNDSRGPTEARWPRSDIGPVNLSRLSRRLLLGEHWPPARWLLAGWLLNELFLVRLEVIL